MTNMQQCYGTHINAKGLPVNPYPVGSPASSTYDLLFYDSLSLFRSATSGYAPNQLASYPYSVVLAKPGQVSQLQQVAASRSVDPRIRLIACHRLRKGGQYVIPKELLGVIVEVGLPGAPDVVAVYPDGAAVYINRMGGISSQSIPTQETASIISRLWAVGQGVVAQLGPSNEPRTMAPQTGMARISFLCSDGVYFGEGPSNEMFSQPLVAPAFALVSQLLRIIAQ